MTNSDSEHDDNQSTPSDDEQLSNYSPHSSESESAELSDSPPPKTIKTRICMYEYKQNDPKRDSGMKLVRIGLARALKPGSSGFKGVLLSAEAHKILSPLDSQVVASSGLAAVN